LPVAIQPGLRRRRRNLDSVPWRDLEATPKLCKQFNPRAESYSTR